MRAHQSRNSGKADERSLRNLLKSCVPSFLRWSKKDLSLLPLIGDNENTAPEENPKLHTEEAEIQTLIAGLLREKMQDARTFFGQYLTILSLYVAINGALLKFALDAEKTLELTTALATFGIFLAWLFATVNHRIRDLIPVYHKEFSSLFFRLKLTAPTEQPVARDVTAPQDLLAASSDELAEMPKGSPPFGSNLRTLHDAVTISLRFCIGLGAGWSLILLLSLSNEFSDIVIPWVRLW